MSYQQFAYLYDQLMEDAPYAKWLTFIKDAAQKHHSDAKRFLDVGCGTGSLSILLAKEGFDVTGVDLSSDMLTVAKEKADREKVSLNLFQQDMRELEDLGLFDCVTILCDSLNYIVTEEDVQKTFHAAANQLEENGLLLFDVHSIHKIQNIFIGNTFASNEEHLSYIWHCYEGDLENSVEHDLSFFIQSGELYERYDEVHIQRTFAVEKYIEWLNDNQFEVIDIKGDFENAPPTGESERILFIAKKIKRA
jgi:SAM-dependent methyltransferase